jgi:hypothetical protein
MDLQAIMDTAGLKPGEEGKLVDAKVARTPYIAEDRIATFAYNWVLYREGFIGRSIIDQARRLVWTTAPAG